MENFTIIHPNDETSWPAELTSYLSGHYDIFSKREEGNYSYQDSVSIAKAYDQAIFGLRPILNKFSLKGFHCTRLTDEEIFDIRSSGMQLPDAGLLRRRIEALQNPLLTTEIVNRLMSENEANDENRVGMIWFCCYPPFLSGQSGIERLFRSWGGEALFNSHENDPTTGSILRKIGTPCLIEATLLIGNLGGNFLDTRFIRQYLKNRRVKTNEPGEHDDYSLKPIPADCINNIHLFPSDEFISLTHCNRWKELL